MGIEFIEVETDLIILYPYVLSGVSCHFSTIEEYPQGAVTVAMPGHLMEILGGLAPGHGATQTVEKGADKFGGDGTGHDITGTVVSCCHFLIHGGFEFSGLVSHRMGQISLWQPLLDVSVPDSYQLVASV